ncbi:thiamine-phosphate pyrophosphorylase [Paucilactobacillus hokkaidonensis JCM 18461]|uniref:Thiamine-phosphate synthase n=2 Tax=Paucilactobacillus hokkaidonensis TaxID=1193095 RepID=A0A0A1GX44_9LACO|nr:thiamine-phosphate pyrophosphorylase [Paucilactobacillus hokkaidonensis JCM 18461]
MLKFKPEMLQVYLIAGTQDVAALEQFLPIVEAAFRAGVTAFQLRDKGKSQLNQNQKLVLARQCRQLTSQYAIPFFIDDDYQLADQVEADGVHVGQKDRQIEEVIYAVGHKMMIGYSCNTEAEILQANHLNIDYVGSGPVFPTKSKADADPAIGLDGLHQLVIKSNYPIVAVGGITENNAQNVIETGVAGISGISLIMQSEHIAATVSEIAGMYR